MGQEIERKFLVAGGGWRAAATAAIPMRQGYFRTAPESTVRVRIAGERAFLTVKGITRNLARSEFEYEIPAADAEAMLREFCAGSLVEKVRHLVPFAGAVWEVDLFSGRNAGLVTAELELPSADAPYTPPPWLGAEVSGNPAYGNSSLARFPYTLWPPEARR